MLLRHNKFLNHLGPYSHLDMFLKKNIEISYHRLLVLKNHMKVDSKNESIKRKSIHSY